MITTIIPCYNCQQHLREAIESVLNQSCRTDEVIVVDDCSTDDSVRVAREYPVRLLTTKTNRGHAAARNIGSDAACGELLAWLDADDIWEPNHLEVLTRLLHRHPDAAVAFARVRQFGDCEEEWPRISDPDSPRSMFWDAFRSTLIPAYTALVRKSALVQVGGHDETFRIAPDFDFWLRLARVQPFVATNEITNNYRRHGAQISSTPQAQIHSIYRARHQMLSRVREEGDDASASAMESIMLGYWNRALRRAWRRRDLEDVRFYLSLRPFVPRATAISNRLRLRSAVPLWAIHTWDMAKAVCKGRAVG